MLADLAGHIANAYEQDVGLDPTSTLKRIKVAFNAEVSSPTDDATGTLMNGKSI